MKSFTIANIISLVVFLSCHDEGPFPDGYDHPCDYMLGSFSLLSSTMNKVVYQGRPKAIFVDSLDHELAFVINEMDRESDKQAIVYTWPDMTVQYYCYESQPVSFLLFNDSLGISINARYLATLHGPDPMVIKVADKVSVLLVDTRGTTSYGHFSKVLDPRTYGEDDYNPQLDSLICFNHIYTQVEHVPVFLESPPSIYYNDTEGVVSFIDGAGKTWCFDRFE